MSDQYRFRVLTSELNLVFCFPFYKECEIHILQEIYYSMCAKTYQNRFDEVIRK